MHYLSILQFTLRWKFQQFGLVPCFLHTVSANSSIGTYQKMLICCQHTVRDGLLGFTGEINNIKDVNPKIQSGAVAKSYGLPNIWGNAQIFPHLWERPSVIYQYDFATRRGPAWPVMTGGPPGAAAAAVAVGAGGVAGTRPGDTATSLTTRLKERIPGIWKCLELA
jgi:hypothetical protein